MANDASVIVEPTVPETGAGTEREAQLAKVPFFEGLTPEAVEELLAFLADLTAEEASEGPAKTE